MLRRRRTIAGAAALIVVLVVLWLPSRLMPSLYRAEATLTMDRGLKPVVFQNDPVAGLVPEQMVNTHRELFTSKAVIDNAMAMGGLMSNPVYARNADPAALLQKRLRSTVAKNSWVMTVSLDDEDPVRAESGLQSVIDAFLAHQATLSRGRTAEDISFIDTQLEDARRKLTVALDNERVFRNENGIASTDPDRNHITERITSLATRQASLDDRLAAGEAQLKQVQQADSITDRQQRLAAYLRIDTISTLTIVGTLQKDLFGLLGQEAELTTIYLDRHPKLLEVRSHIATKRGQLEDTIAAARTSIESDYHLLLEQRDGLIRSQHELQSQLNTYRERLVQLQGLANETKAQQGVFNELLARRSQLAAMSGYDERRMTLESRPRSSPVPGGIATLPIAALALLAGIASAVVAAGIADSLDNTLRDARKVRELTGVRSLGDVPMITGLQPIAATGPADPPELAEAIRALWTSLRYAFGRNDGCHIVLISSPGEGDGRSTIAARLAVGTAMAGTRTLLVDADLRRPSLAAQLAVARHQGLAQLLTGEPDISPAPTAIPLLELMPAGLLPANPGELLNSHCLAEWLTLCRERFELIIIDAPSLSRCSDALVVGDQCDGVILVVRMGSTSHTQLSEAWAKLEPLRAKVLGVATVQDRATV